MPPRFTAQQAQVVQYVADSSRHLLIRATAGSGKTTTLTEAAWHLPDFTRAVYFVYNTHATAGVAPRLPAGIPARTLHAHGMGLLARTGKGAELQVQDDKTLHLLRDTGLLPAGETRFQRALSFTLRRAWDVYRELHLTRSPDDLALLLSLAGWPNQDGEDAGGQDAFATDGQRLSYLDRVLGALKDASLDAFATRASIDYTDMLWLPMQLGLGRGHVRTALVDEAQDLTPLRQQFVSHIIGLRSRTPGRLILCGDPEQSIYGYMGALPDHLPRLARDIGAVDLPLSVSFRCPVAVVAIAQTVSDFIQPAPGAPLGTVEHHPAESLTFERGDVVLCRLNAPLIRLALTLMTRGVSLHVKGRDVHERLVIAARDAFPDAFSAQQVEACVTAFQARRAAPIQRALERGERGARRQLQDLKDLCRCLSALAEQVSASGPATASDIKDVLDRLYTTQGDVLLCTVHKAKGLEWPRVTVLYPELMPLHQGDPDEERCVQFVAYTRAQQTLRFAYGKQAWDDGLRVTPHQDPPTAQPAHPVPVPDVAVSVLPPRPPAQPLARTPVRIDDERDLPLFGGPDVIDVPPLTERLTALADDSRPALRQWAAASLELLGRMPARQVYVHGAHLKQFERAASAARLAIPAFGQLPGRTVRVMVFENGLARWKHAQVNRTGPRVISVTLGGQTLRFDARTGEPLGLPLTPLGVHLDPKVLAS
ncbi:UvrD-helicase domain-containing protein [Deinococcus soli (ex Cha et al. 2016)]|uniref:UvrD-helicase domain-containing protein n=1 Tax=Deinococcus soli (ex Cha et al. 2016) TaxID=1309411 RepID=UPI0036092D42